MNATPLLTRGLIRLSICIAFALPTIKSVAQEAGTQETGTSQSLLVMHSYLISPAFKSNLVRQSTGQNVDVEFIAFDSADADQIDAAIKQADFVLVDLPHSSVNASFLDRAGQPLSNAEQPYVLIGEMKQVREDTVVATDSVKDRRGVSESKANFVRRYYRFGGKQNTQELIRAIANPSDKDLSTPVEFPEQGLYHPDWPSIQTDLSKAVGQFEDAGRPLIAIAINPIVLTADDTQWLHALINAFTDRGLNSYAFYGPRNNPNRFTELTCLDENGTLKPRVDLIINAALVFRPNERKQQLESIGVPVMQTLPALTQTRNNGRLATWDYPPQMRLIITSQVNWLGSLIRF